MTQSRLYIGLDVGSISVNAVLMDERRGVLEEHYIRTKGQPRQTVVGVLKDIFGRIAADKIDIIALTGSGGRSIAEFLQANFVNEIIAQARSVEFLYPEAKTVIEIGGEDSKLILLDYDQSLQAMTIQDFAMNTICAAGTGSFLDQQASRLGISIEKEFERLALKSKSPPRIAGRCSVFAKSDMIHLQQEATPDYDIVAGLCYALARNFKSNIAKGKRFIKPIVFQGGVAANKGMIKAFEDILNLDTGELIIPKNYASMGAIGAVLITLEKKKARKDWVQGLKNLEDYMSKGNPVQSSLESLGNGVSLAEAQIQHQERRYFAGAEIERINAYLGVDVGSISTNVVAIDDSHKVLAKRYLMTAGRPIEAVRHGIEEIGKEVGSYIEVKGVTTTGSGRYLIGNFIGADVVKNEITAQATAAAFVDKNVDTIFEIGGQDSKYISLENGAIVDFAMNKVCAAGTGSFLEEQAEKLNINIKEEFGKLALSANNPVPLGERCTVFMESDLVSHQQNGARKDDLVAGLCYSIVYNYLNRVVAGKKVGNNIFFQGGVAFNKGVVAAFEKVTGKKITVPEHHEVTGAIGAAIIAKESMNGHKSHFKGFDLSRKNYEVETFECQDCSNHCEIKKVTLENEQPLYYGSRCEKYNIKTEDEAKKETPNLFAEREKFLLNTYQPSTNPNRKSTALKIGIPRALIFYELYPFWQAFFSELGFEVVLSDRTTKKIIHEGLENTVAETCFPVKIMHGHVLNLLKKGVDYVFLPSIINMKHNNPKLQGGVTCPYVQTIPYIIKSAIDVKASGVEMLQPIIFFQRGRKHLEKVLTELGEKFKKKSKEIKRAIRIAEETQESFYSRLQHRGKEIIDNLKGSDRAIVIVSRPYNGCDPGINLNLPKKLSDLGVIAIPMDFLPLDSVDISKDWPNMYWRYGQKILSAAEFIRTNEMLYAVYITSFSCGPDSFIINYFKEKMGTKPYLQIEVDEHSADTGAITRCEAFLDSLANAGKHDLPEAPKKRGAAVSKNFERTIYIPYMCNHAFAIQAAFAANGISAEVLPKSDSETLEWGRKFTSGKECYPCIITTGDMIKKTKESGFDPGKSAFFMPSGSGPCRFGQYNQMHRMVLDKLGCHDVPVIAPDQGESFYNELDLFGADFTRKSWQGIVAIDILEKLQREISPYEVVQGETEKLFEEYLEKVRQAIIDGDLMEVMRQAKKAFAQVEVDGTKQKPIIGIVGEIFVRSNRFSNCNIVEEIEELGCEVWLPPIAEWFLYINHTRKVNSLAEKKYAVFANNFIKEIVQIYDEHKLQKPFKKSLRNLKEPTIKQTLGFSEPYIHPSFEGEAVLSMGKSVDFARKGLSGIINTMPFTCMPGTIVATMLKKLREDYDNIPCLTIAYDGLEQTNAKTRLEAFIYQAHQFRNIPFLR